MTTVGHDGGYIYPASYVQQVERAQAWHLPDPPDPAPVEQGIGVYFTSLRVGGVDFAILEDRKFNTGPAGKIPQMGPRPYHITDDKYDRQAVDVPGLQLLGERRIRWLDGWTRDWSGAQLKCVLSQTAFCGAVHLHGQPANRLLADPDCNRFDKRQRTVTFECWPRFANISDGDKAQYPGWPVTVSMDQNDGRETVGWLPELVCKDGTRPVVQVIEDSTGEVLYTVRAGGYRFRPRVYSQSSHTIQVGRNKPDGPQFRTLVPRDKDDRSVIEVSL